MLGFLRRHARVIQLVGAGRAGGHRSADGHRRVEQRHRAVAGRGRGAVVGPLDSVRTTTEADLAAPTPGRRAQGPGGRCCPWPQPVATAHRHAHRAGAAVPAGAGFVARGAAAPVVAEHGQDRAVHPRPPDDRPDPGPVGLLPGLRLAVVCGDLSAAVRVPGWLPGPADRRVRRPVAGETRCHTAQPGQTAASRHRSDRGDACRRRRADPNRAAAQGVRRLAGRRASTNPTGRWRSPPSAATCARSEIWCSTSRCSAC